MPVDQKALLADCQKLLKLLETDLKAQATALPELDASLRAGYDEAREAGRVGDAFEIWRGEQVTQGAVHWVLGGVFVRFLEDNALIDPAIAGAGDRGRLAEAAEQTFYAEHPTLHERDWLRHVFRSVSSLPSGDALFDEAHNPAFRWALSPDAAKALVQFWRRPDPAHGELIHDFADAAWDTRFLGDLYQDLSEGARKKYALLQTPVFVEEFILDRTLDQALKALPLDRVTMIDPTCGSGHFLLGAFARLLHAWEVKQPEGLREALVQRALDQVAGVDLNPFAAAIARFRLLLAALRACDVARLDRAPAFHLHVAVGDTLLHGDEPGMLALGDVGRGRFVRHAFGDEDLAKVNALLGRRYSVVVGNPPYITPKDKALNVAYRQRYKTCHRQYALSVPFVERFWELASTDAGGGVAGWMGQITASSFMKREFGKKLVEEFLPSVDLTHVIDTGGAYIPGHGTPTVILFGRARRPVTDTVRSVMGIQGEPATPNDPSTGHVWTAILTQVDLPGSESAFVSVADTPRASFAKHPWSLGGGGAAELRQLIDESCPTTVASVAKEIGAGVVPREDEAYLVPASSARRLRISPDHERTLVEGENVRDWTINSPGAGLWPYNPTTLEAEIDIGLLELFWPLRTTLSNRLAFGETQVQRGLQWYEYSMFFRERNRTPLSITQAFVATHNHFVLDRNQYLFNRSAPVIKLPDDATEDAHLGLLGLLNSSVACFWLKQVSHNMGSTVDQAGARQRTAAFEDFYQYNSTKVGAFPVPSERPIELASALDSLAVERGQQLPDALAAATLLSRDVLNSARSAAESCLAQMVSLQEELDWHVYRLYGITTDDLSYRDESGARLEGPSLSLGERAFEIVLARRIAAGFEESTWFARHGSKSITEVPTHWPENYRTLVNRRIVMIESDLNTALLERPEYKRRWNLAAWPVLERNAIASWLLDRLESPSYWTDVSLKSTRELAACAATDAAFGHMAALYAGEGVALEPIIRELTLGEAVPFLPVLRYKDSGREKRRVWERVWELQRREDDVDTAVAREPAFAVPREGESVDGVARRLAEWQRVRRVAEVGVVPRPPKYVSADFQRSEYWRMRGALDLPKERFIVYPHCNRDGDDAPLLGWAGWNRLEQAQSLSTWYADRTQQDGWSGERLLPLLAGMAELVPWLLQWHNELDPALGDRPGATYASWLNEELQAQGLTRAALDGWEPPHAARRGNRRATAKRAPALVTEDSIMDATADAAE